MSNITCFTSNHNLIYYFPEKPSTIIDQIHNNAIHIICTAFIFSWKKKKLTMVAHIIASCVIDITVDIFPPFLSARIYIVLPSHQPIR